MILRSLMAGLLLLTTAAAAPEYRYQLDGAASEVAAKVSFLGLASKTARFPRMSGAIQLRPERLDTINLDVTLDARAIAASDGDTQRRLRGPDFFDAENHPTIRFTGQRMAMGSQTSALVDGTVTARGVTRPVRLKVTFSKPPAQTTGREPIGFTATTTIDRYQFGMKAYSMVVGRNVNIMIKARMTPG